MGLYSTGVLLERFLRLGFSFIFVYEMNKIKIDSSKDYVKDKTKTIQLGN